MCAVLEFPVSTYYAVKDRERQPSAREVRDEYLKEQIMRVWEDRRKGRGVYGARKIWRQLRREGTDVARCTVERLMRELGIAGVSAQRKKPRTTVPAGAEGRPRRLASALTSPLGVPPIESAELNRAVPVIAVVGPCNVPLAFSVPASECDSVERSVTLRFQGKLKIQAS